MKIVADSICEIGGRDYNQDFAQFVIDGVNSCLVACDGLGSYAGSEIASKLSAQKILDDYMRIKDIDPLRATKKVYVESYLLDAHNVVTEYKEKNPQIGSSCTTVACVTTNESGATLAHIGDTRIYFFKNNTLSYQSRDHSLSQTAVDHGIIKLRDIRTHKDQNKLTRVLGSDYYIAPEIVTLNEPLNVGDSFIICSDGFWEYVYEEEMEEDLKNSSTPKEALEKMEERLKQRVNGYNDNYTAIVAMIVD